MENLQKQIEEINKKIDFIVEEIEHERRHRTEMEDLKEDLVRVGKDVYNTAIIELEEVHDNLKTGDILHLFKKLLRNINNLTKTFEQLENLRDFIDDFGPVSKELVFDFMAKLNELDKKGYFELMRDLSRVFDNTVAVLKKEDIKNLNESIPLMINTLRNIVRPEILQSMNTVLTEMNNIKIQKEISLFGLMKELNNPEVKKGLVYVIEFLKIISKINLKGE